jgi:hypothetical protein
MAQNAAKLAANHATHRNSGGVAGTRATDTAAITAKKAARRPIVRFIPAPGQNIRNGR